MSSVLSENETDTFSCLDCLDRTNLVQSMISQMALESFLAHRSETASSDFWVRHSSLWADNGDVLSKIYAGTGALKSSFTRHGKMSLAGAIADARKSATRLYVNNFADKDRQNTIDLLLGRLMGQTPVHLFDPISDYVTTELNRQAASYSSAHPIHMWAGTFNLNGRGSGLEEDLSPWLCARAEALGKDPEIMAIGFQEIVELSPQQIMATDPARRQTWEIAVQETINKHARRRGSDDYVLLRSGQLVGAALMIFVKASVLPSLRNVEGSIKKTGLSGMAGNKGAVAIRLDYSSTSICFVTAHLAAGFANYEERNRDYRTISHGLHFQKNRSIADHDTIIWLGDFNYRIGLSDERARRLVAAGDLETLYENDQLNLQMVAGLAFQYYSEARITFLPTYKFNLNSDEYDTSEKARIPAWTDRILRKGTNLKQIDYNSAPLRFSDHRPVYATFECMVTEIDDKKRAQLSKAIYARRREELGTDHAALDRDLDSEEDADLLGYDAVEPGLPPASSDRRKWWLDNGMPSRSEITPPRSGMLPNPQRPSNPWTKPNNGEPEWIDHREAKSKPQPPPPRKRTIVTPVWEGSAEASRSTSVSSTASRPARPLISSGTVPQRQISNATTSSTLSQTPSLQQKKSPPPKPKKPISLASPTPDSASSSSVALSPVSSSSAYATPQQGTPRPRVPSTSSTTIPSRNPSTASTTVSKTPSTATANRAPRPLPPPTSRRDSAQSFRSTASSSTVNPPLPPRPQNTTTTPTSAPRAKIPAQRRDNGPLPPPRRVGTNRGPMDEEPDEVETGGGLGGAWEVLRPEPSGSGRR